MKKRLKPHWPFVVGRIGTTNGQHRASNTTSFARRKCGERSQPFSFSPIPKITFSCYIYYNDLCVPIVEGGFRPCRSRSKAWLQRLLFDGNSVRHCCPLALSLILGRACIHACTRIGTSCAATSGGTQESEGACVRFGGRDIDEAEERRSNGASVRGDRKAGVDKLDPLTYGRKPLDGRRPLSSTTVRFKVQSPALPSSPETEKMTNSDEEFIMELNRQHMDQYRRRKSVTKLVIEEAVNNAEKVAASVLRRESIQTLAETTNKRKQTVEPVATGKRR